MVAVDVVDAADEPPDAINAVDEPPPDAEPVDAVLCLGPVSYTHLTLPTIYSE